MRAAAGPGWSQGFQTPGYRGIARSLAADPPPLRSADPDMQPAPVVFFGTCQAQSLCKIYNTQINRDSLPAKYINSNLPLTPENHAAFRAAPAIVAQVFSFEQKSTLEGEDLRARIVRFPYLAGWFLWPYASQDHIRRQYFKTARIRPYDEEIGDAFLNRQIKDAISPEEATARYLDLDIIRKARVETRYELVAHQQRQREDLCDVKAWTYIEDNIADPDLFMTRGHPGLGLLLHVAAQVWEQLGVARDDIDRAGKSLLRVPDHRNQAPIHPKIAEHFGIKGDPYARRFAQFLGAYTFEECCLRYMRYDWNQDLMEGVFHVNERNDQAALESLTRGLRQEPHSAVACHAYGMLLQRLGRLPEAEQYFRQARELDDQNPFYAIHLANCLNEMFRPADAEAELRAAARQWPAIAEVQLALSHLLAKRGLLPEAIAKARETVALTVRPATAFRHLAKLLVRNKEVTEAAEILRKLLQETPDDEPLLRELRDVQALVNPKPAPPRPPEQAEPRTPKDPNPLLLTADAAARSGENRVACDLYRDILADEPDDRTAHARLAYLLPKLDRGDEAIEAGLAALRADASDRKLLLHMASLLERAGRLRDAVDCYLAFLAMERENRAVHMKLSQVFARLGCFSEAYYAALCGLGDGPPAPETRRWLQELHAKRNGLFVLPDGLSTQDAGFA
jgi:tetratricopeptide (TPR) repeat protein